MLQETENLEILKKIAQERIALKKFREQFLNTPSPGVSIILPTSKKKYVDNIFYNYKRVNYPEKELIIIINNNSLDINSYKAKARNLENIRIYQLDESCTLGECLNFGVLNSKFDYISKMDDDDYYGPNYLIDSMNVFKYTDAKVTGKTTRFIYFESSKTLAIWTIDNKNCSYIFYPHVSGGTILFKKEVSEKLKFRNLNVGEDYHFLQDCSDRGIKTYSSDKYNYIYFKHIYPQDHTWISTEEELKYGCIEYINTINYEPIVTV